MMSNDHLSRDVPVLTTTRPEIAGHRIVEVLGVVLGEADGLLDAYAEMEEQAVEYEADGIVDVRTTAVGAGDGVNRAQIRWGAIGTAVRLEPAQEPAQEPA